MKVKILTLLFAFTLFSTVGCSSKQKTIQIDQEQTMVESDLYRSWELVKLYDDKGQEVDLKEAYKGGLPTVAFNKEKNNVKGFDGCNSFNGNVLEVSGSQVDFGDYYMSTEMYCEGVSSGDFLRALATATSYAFDKGELLLKFDGAVIAVFKPTK
ncbi:META domain-containing protein [Myroides pelagicus]|uniref:META domain-containing protein n=1 Tax=Myroides pelagicus TaxID=270914 RepID=UPI002DBBB443|nr:META domain-containing protein [Myroides pelagicus]MEC4114083.1 META domain-containing protein [Myroides pelagicus]